jgi:hypothetical protein
MASQLEIGRRTVSAAAAAAAQDGNLVRRLEDLQQSSKVDAIALFGESDSLVAWAGEHRGRVPTDIRRGLRTVWFNEGPLYSYLYFTQRLRANRGTAVVAMLLDAALPAETNSPGIVPTLRR